MAVVDDRGLGLVLVFPQVFADREPDSHDAPIEPDMEWLEQALQRNSHFGSELRRRIEMPCIVEDAVFRQVGLRYPAVEHTVAHPLPVLGDECGVVLAHAAVLADLVPIGLDRTPDDSDALARLSYALVCPLDFTNERIVFPAV